MFVDDLFETTKIHVKSGMQIEPVDQCYFVISGMVRGKYGTKRVINFSAAKGEFFGVCGVLFQINNSQARWLLMIVNLPLSRMKN